MKLKNPLKLPILLSLLFACLFCSTRGFASEVEKLFKKHCASCHGENAEGAKASALRKEGLLITAEADFFIKSIKFGRPLSGCPSFDDKLSKAQIESLAKYIKGWQKGKLIEAPSHNVSAKNDSRGKELFAICGACHGLKIEGAMGPPLLDPGFLKSASDTMLRRTIMYGRPGTPMKGFLKGEGGFPLSPEDIDSLISYIRYTQLPKDKDVVK
ncbi:MAG: c-type cytochrome [bacterium]|nr:c-type cytochrome [bacterium]